ncbi:head GIN domain-containing protein [Flavobacterium panacagri]|uniref:head GIN domain-containing protein n=1 Tax=Flavobacterium panacagri TaxID=3034146 RepID=UPI0025A68E28|nr:head GIN domain-containing protein [Flavobacterium panacagri]
MIKIIIHITKFVIATITALLFASCNFNMNAIEGSGNVTTEKRTVQGDFTNIKVSNAIDVVIEQSESKEIIVEADDNLQKEIVTKVENGTLIIECKYNSFRNIASKKVTVKMPIVDKIEASTASSVQSKNVIEGENIILETSSAASIQANIESDKISVDSSSGGSVAIEGKALSLSTSVSSGGSIDAGKLMANDIHAEASSGGTISIRPIVSLKAEASSGGNINYGGSPKTIEKSESSGGNVSKS